MHKIGALNKILPVLLLLAANVNAATVSVVNPAQVSEGETFQITIVGDFLGEGLIAGGLQLFYDPALLQVDNVQLDLNVVPDFSCPGAALCPVDPPGTVSIVWGEFLNDLIPAGAGPATMATITMTALSPGISALPIVSFDVFTGGWFGAGFVPIDTPTFNQGSVSIVEVGACDLDGEVTAATGAFAALTPPGTPVRGPMNIDPAAVASGSAGLGDITSIDVNVGGFCFSTQIPSQCPLGGADVPIVSIDAAALTFTGGALGGPLDITAFSPTFQLPIFVNFDFDAGTFFATDEFGGALLGTVAGSIAGSCAGTSAQPDIDLRKEVSLDGGPFLDANTPESGPFGQLGADAEYRLVVENTGTETLNGASITDATLSLADVPVPGGPLLPGDIRTISSADDGYGTMSVNDRCDSVGQKLNIARVDATGETSRTPVDSEDPAYVNCENPMVDMLKQVSLDGVNFFDADAPGSGPVGIVGSTDATYRFIIFNDGSEVLTNVRVQDPTLGIDQIIADLVVGEARIIDSGHSGFAGLFQSMRCGGTAGNKSNIASVSATGANTGTAVGDDDPANVLCLAPPPKLTLLKVVENGSNPGGTESLDAWTLTAIGPGGSFSGPSGAMGIFSVGGDYDLSESGPAGYIGSDWDCNGGVQVDGDTITLIRGDEATCTITNTAMGMVDLLKLTDGVENQTMIWNFTLAGPGVDESDSSPPTTVDFGGVKLIPGEEYTLCETGIPAGWTLEWQVDTDGDGIPDTIIPMVAGVDNDPVDPVTGVSRVYDPNYAAPPAQFTNDARCVNFVVDVGETLAFQIDNQFPGGEPRTIGFWKNWNTCTSGNQAATAAANGGPDEGWFILDDLLNDPGFTIGVLSLDGDDCEDAVNILDKRKITGKKRASDAAYNLAAQLLAAQVNLSGGAETCQDVVDAVNAGQVLLSSISFDGTGNYLRPKDEDYATANDLAATLDAYNNGSLCGP